MFVIAKKHYLLNEIIWLLLMTKLVSYFYAGEG